MRRRRYNLIILISYHCYQCYQFQLDYPPSLLGRLLLEQYLKESAPSDEEDEEGEGGGGGRRRGRDRELVTEMLRNPQSISDPVLATEIRICSLQDDVYGPVSEAVK